MTFQGRGSWWRTVEDGAARRSLQSLTAMLCSTCSVASNAETGHAHHTCICKSLSNSSQNLAMPLLGSWSSRAVWCEDWRPAWVISMFESTKKPHTQKQWTATLKNNGQPHSLACLILGNKMHLDHTDSHGMSNTLFQLSAPTARQLGGQGREKRSDVRMFLWVDKVLQFNSLWLTLINLEKPNTISNEIV